MRLLFVTFWNMDDAATNGIAKKIFAQRAAFTRLGAEVDLCYAQNGSYYLERGGEKIRLCATRKYTTRIAAARALSSYLRREKPRYDAAYIRYALADGGLASLAETLRAQGVKTVVEIPTYPYEKEFQTGLLRLSLLMDQLYRTRVAKNIDRYVIYADYDAVYGVKTIKTTNGVDVTACPEARLPGEQSPIHLIAVAGFSPWHAYERLIEGLLVYRDNGGKRAFHLDFVGGGTEKSRYEALVANANLGDSIQFHGFLSGETLNAVYDGAHIAVDSLGLFRLGLKYSTSLKSFEYLVRGLPIVTLGRQKPHPALEPYTLKVPADESPIDFAAIADFYDRVYGAPDFKLRERIRAAALPLCDMAATLKPVYAYFAGEDA